MKNKLHGICRAAIAWVVVVSAGIGAAYAQNTAFTYNGRLTGNGALVTGLYDMQFTLFDAINGNGVAAGPLDSLAVGVTNGLFTVRIDFGAGKFTGPPRWLEVAVRPSGGGSFTNLSPRQEVTASPYSIRSQSAGTSDSGGGGNDSIWAVTANNAHYTNGNVGIGTTVPATALEVAGLVRSARIGNASQYLQLDGGFNAGDPLSIRLTAQSIAGAEKSLVIRNLSGDATPGANNAIQFAVGTTASPSTKMTINKDGNVLINPVGGSTIQFGTPAFETGMTIIGANRADLRFDGATLKLLAGAGPGIPPAANGIAIDTAGNVGIGKDLRYEGALSKLDVAENFTATLRAGDFFLGHSLRRGAPGRALVDFGSTLHLNFAGDWGSTQIGGTNTWFEGSASVKTLTIRGGADVAEPFMMPEEITKGAVVVIDEAHPGQLKLSTQAYDTRVAGIVSGANGINPGIALHQEGVMEGGQNVALSGRVYVLADADTGAIKPGDLLTTSNLPGHAMKVADHAKAQGAILGKAMSGLKVGRGTVLVLVTLQ